MRPLIGITCRATPLPARSTPFQGTFASYIDAIHEAGGSAVLLPIQPHAANQAALHACAGLLIPGGEDFDPSHGRRASQTARSTGASPRDLLELHALRAMLRLKKPILGICRGAHIITVALGGRIAPIDTLVAQDTIAHDNGHHHTVTLTPRSRLSSILNCPSHLDVISRHRIGIALLPKQFSATAISMDGSIEAIEHSVLPIIGILWHPEMDMHNTASKRLFKWFVRAASTAPKEK